MHPPDPSPPPSSPAPDPPWHEPTCASVAAVVRRGASEGWSPELESEADDLESYLGVQLERLEDVLLGGPDAEGQPKLMQALETLQGALEQARQAGSALPGREAEILGWVRAADEAFASASRRAGGGPPPNMPPNMPPGLPGPLLRHPPRGAMIHGCLLLVMAMAIISTFAAYNAGKPAFHLVVAVAAVAGLAGCWARYGLCAQVGALLTIAVPAAVSAGLGYGRAVDADTLMGLSAFLYVGATVIFVGANLVRAVLFVARSEDELEKAS